jgi:hypothetical protein
MTLQIREYDNPPHVEWVRHWIYGIAILLFIAIVIFGFALDKWLAAFVGCGIAILYLSGIWQREYYRRPSKIIIEDGGIRALFRYKPERFVSWNEVRWLSAPPGDPSKLKEAYDRDGYMHLQGKVFYPLYWPVAIAVRGAFREQNGFYPPRRESETFNRSTELQVPR